MTSGMVLVIVMRHIDLSVGSVLGFTGMIIGVTQVYLLPHFLGLGGIPASGSSPSSSASPSAR